MKLGQRTNLVGLAVILLVGLVLATTLISYATSGGPYRLVQSVIATGGGAKWSGRYQLQGTMGQPVDPSLHSDGAYQLASGYWGSALFAGPTPTPKPTPVFTTWLYVPLVKKELDPSAIRTEEGER
jgi:amino acid transporter